MTRPAAALALALWAGAPAPVAAHVVEVTTSVAVSQADDAQIKAALRSAVDEALRDATAFRPALVVLTHALVVGDRLYIRLLLVDEADAPAYEDQPVAPEPAPGAPASDSVF